MSDTPTPELVEKLVQLYYERATNRDSPHPCFPIDAMSDLAQAAFALGEARTRERDARIVMRATIPGHSVCGAAHHEAIAAAIRAADTEEL